MNAFYFDDIIDLIRL